MIKRDKQAIRREEVQTDHQRCGKQTNGQKQTAWPVDMSDRNIQR